MLVRQLGGLETVFSTLSRTMFSDNLMYVFKFQVMFSLHQRDAVEYVTVV
jgi:hypothetical protein